MGAYRPFILLPRVQIPCTTSILFQFSFKLYGEKDENKLKKEAGVVGPLFKKFTQSPGQVVMGDDSCSKGYGFKSRRHILDGNFDIFSH